VLKKQGSFNLVQNMEHKGPVLRSRCIGSGRAQTKYYSILFFPVSWILVGSYMVWKI